LYACSLLLESLDLSFLLKKFLTWGLIFEVEGTLHVLVLFTRDLQMSSFLFERDKLILKVFPFEKESLILERESFSFENTILS